MTQDSYYSDTAFNSTKPVVQEPAPEQKSFVQRSAEKHELKGTGVHCMEYTAIQDMRDIELLLAGHLKRIPSL